jgi:hypothetical protein
MRCACPGGITRVSTTWWRPRSTCAAPADHHPAAAALAQGERYCREHPATAAAFLTRLSPEGRAALLAGWPSHHFRLELDQSLLLVLEDQSRWAIKRA